MTKSKDKLSRPMARNKIAVIGMACRFPGAKSLEDFWANLVNCRDTIHTFTDDDLTQAGVSKQLVTHPYYIKRRGILTDIEYFDADFFKMTPTQATIMDPQHRLFMEICQEALDNAGYGDRNNALFAGVFAGMSDSTYLTNFLMRNSNFLKTHDPYKTHIATSGHFFATRISYHLNLKGPSVNIQTACSTSLVSVIKACQALEVYECDIALAGGVTVRVPQTRGYLYQEGGILSKDGICRAFDKFSNGTVSSNGLGVVVLKRLEDAIRDKDSIDAIIISYALNNDGGAKNGYAAPSVQGQTLCVSSALQHVYPESVSYIEAHGTGTLLGDPIEIASLTNAFKLFTDKKNFCAIGSVKTNIGHTDTAAGIAGFIKTALALKNKIIPASLHFSENNPYINFEASPFYVQSETAKWMAHSPRIAGVSSFGIGGTNAHIILQESIESGDETKRADISPTQFIQKRKYWLELEEDSNKQDQIRQNNYLYLPYWEPSSLKGQFLLDEKKSWLIFANETSVVKECVKQLIAAKQEVICVYQGEKFEKTSDGYRLNNKIKNEYKELLQSLYQENKHFNYVLHFWSINEKNDDVPSKSNHSYLANQLISLVFFCQVFTKHTKGLMRLIVITHKSQQVIKGDPIIPEHSALIAPCLTIPQEYKNVTCKFIDIPTKPSSPASLAKILIRESAFKSKDNLIAYRNEIRFIRMYKDLLIDYTKNRNLLKEKGTYLIMGASGKIGIRLAQYLASHFSAHLILMVRRKLDNNFLDKKMQDEKYLWEKVKNDSSSLKIIYADLNDNAYLSQVIDEVKASYQKIDGIFHLAADIQSTDTKALINDIKMNQVTTQIMPKISGVKIALRISEIIPTSFICLFSSLSSTLGGVGLTSYIAGNAYLDIIAEKYKDNDSQWLSINLDAISIEDHDDRTNPSKLSLSQMLQLISGFSKENINESSRVIISALPLKERLASASKIKLNRVLKQEIEQQPKYISKKEVKTLFQVCLGLSSVDYNKSFYELGGDSLDAIRLVELLEKQFHIRLTLSELTTYNSIGKLIQFINNKASAEKIQHLVKLNRFCKSLPTLFLIHPIGGTTFCYLKLAGILTDKINCYGIQDISMNFQYNSMEEMAKNYLNTILETQLTDDFYMGGFSFGSSLAFEMARQLKELGKRVRPVFMIDGWAAFSEELASYQKFSDGMKLALEEVKNNLPAENVDENMFIDLAWSRAKLLLQYQPSSVDVPIILFKADKLLPEYASVDDPTNYWSLYTKDILNVYSIMGNHNDILRSDHVKDIAKIIEQSICKTK
jgi:acyl transferase domain-containing protein/thioesterase domain-containing protein/acyl carrier protein